MENLAGLAEIVGPIGVLVVVVAWARPGRADKVGRPPGWHRRGQDWSPRPPRRRGPALGGSRQLLNSILPHLITSFVAASAGLPPPAGVVAFSCHRINLYTLLTFYIAMIYNIGMIKLLQGLGILKHRHNWMPTSMATSQGQTGVCVECRLQGRIS